MVIGKRTRTCARNSKCSATSTEFDNKCPDQLSLLVKKTAVCRITQIPQAESFDLKCVLESAMLIHALRGTFE